jgi:hypothetical protein
MKSILVGHIPEPGLWKRAPLITPSGHKATSCHGDPRWAWIEAHVPQPAVVHDDWHVCLDDTLGLGLAGLAATVALRLGLNMDGRHLASCTPWFVVKAWRDAGHHLEHADTFTQLCAIATYVRLTDDLCKALDLVRAQHKVALWNRNAQGEWVLLVVDGGWHSGIFDEDDWQAALETALLAMQVGSTLAEPASPKS